MSFLAEVEMKELICTDCGCPFAVPQHLYNYVQKEVEEGKDLILCCPSEHNIFELRVAKLKEQKLKDAPSEQVPRVADQKKGIRWVRILQVLILIFLIYNAIQYWRNANKLEQLHNAIHYYNYKPS